MDISRKDMTELVKIGRSASDNGLDVMDIYNAACEAREECEKNGGKGDLPTIFREKLMNERRNDNVRS